MKYILLVAAAIPIVAAFLLRKRMRWQTPTYLAATGALFGVGWGLFAFNGYDANAFAVSRLAWYASTLGLFLLALAASAILFGVIEYGLLRLGGTLPVGAIARVTYYEALLQPFTIILLFVGITCIVLAAFLPYFTINEDHKMFRDVAVSLTFLFTLPIMIFSSTKVIDEEIENRTMLTLMSKPIARWQVVVGKYLGVLLLCFVVLATLGFVAGVCSYLRYFDDMRLDYVTNTSVMGKQLLDYANVHAIGALIPAIILQFMQIATLAAISVAVSTRFGLALNITVVVILYMGANLARYASLAIPGGPVHWVVTVIAGILPGLGYLDLNQRLIFGDYNYGTWRFLPGLPTYTQIWQYVGCAAVYTVLYIGASLQFGIALFRNRELS